MVVVVLLLVLVVIVVVVAMAQRLEMITAGHMSDVRRPFLSAHCHIGDADVTGFFFEKKPSLV